MLGLEKEGNVLSLHPAIPEDWDGFTLTCSFAEGEAEIACQRISSEKRGLYIDGGKAPDDKLYLDARKKQAVYYLPAKKA